MFQTIAASLCGVFLLYGAWLVAGELVTRRFEEAEAAPQPVPGSRTADART